MKKQHEFDLNFVKHIRNPRSLVISFLRLITENIYKKNADKTNKTPAHFLGRVHHCVLGLEGERGRGGGGAGASVRGGEGGGQGSRGGGGEGGGGSS